MLRHDNAINVKMGIDKEKQEQISDLLLLARVSAPADEKAP